MCTYSKFMAYWIRSDTLKLKQFVSIRIWIVLDNSIRSEWRWLPTKINVNDTATEDRDNMSFTTQEWLTGSNWIWIMTNRNRTNDLWHTWNENQSTYEISNSLPEDDIFSSWVKLFRATVWVLIPIKSFLLMKSSTQNVVTTQMT